MVRRGKALFKTSLGQLRLGESDADARLRSYASESNPEAPPLTLRVQSSGGDAAHWLVVQPVAGLGDGVQMLLVSVRVRDDANIVNAERVMAALGLTMAEAELTVALATGSTIREFAEITQRKVPTLRWHLSNILRKAECADQAELARTVLLMSL